MKINLIKISTYLGVALFTTGVSYYMFGKFIPVNSQSSTNTVTTDSTTPGAKKTGVIVFAGPKTEVCPINGLMYTKEEKDIWSKRRPMEIMVENHLDSRPQSGLQSADVIYEAVAEGGITRFMGVFYCGVVAGSTAQKYDVGPVRSARTYFLDLASEYADYPLYAHVGGANCSAATPGGPCTTNKKAQAIEQIQQYGWNNQGTWGDLSQFSLSYKACRREAERTGQLRDTEHTVYCSTNEMYNVASNRGLTNVTTVKNQNWDKNFRPWLFKQTDQASTNPTDTTISFDFWSGYKDYSVSWTYDKSQNIYLRNNGGQKHIDFNDGSQLSTKNLVIQFVKETRSVDEHGHMLYDVVGSGKGILYQNGIKSDITWTKANRISRTIYKDASGKEINFVPGKIWIEILSIGNVISNEG